MIPMIYWSHMITAFFFILGLAIGSFLNVVVLRLESEKPLDGRSKCPSCGALIRWYDNIPLLSFFLLGRKCRQCRFPISWLYPSVELGTAVLFAFFGSVQLGSATGPEIVTIAWSLFLVSILVAIAVYDGRNMEIPLVLLAIGLGGAAVAALALGSVAPVPWADPSSPWRDMFLGAVIAAGIFYALVYFSKETWMGMGDVWLAGIAGAAVGLPALLLLFTLSFSVGALVGGILMLAGRRGMKSQVPFAPFLAVGTLATVALQTINPWWLGLFLIPLV
jgi:prepilin signal peptidase PulO-like enzyme (type II secretory pathway)